MCWNAKLTRADESDRSRDKWRCYSFLSEKPSNRTLQRVLRSTVSAGKHPAVKVPCANWDDEPGDPHRPSPGLSQFSQASSCFFLFLNGITWSCGQRRGEGGSDSRLITSETALCGFTQILLLQRCLSHNQAKRGHQERASRGWRTRDSERDQLC